MAVTFGNVALCSHWCAVVESERNAQSRMVVIVASDISAESPEKTSAQLPLPPPPPEMVAMGVVALHIISLNFPFAGYAIMRGAAFQALGKSVYSMNISLVRQLLIIIPCAYIFAKIGGVDMVWWAFPCAEVAGFTMSALYTKRIRKTIISKMTPRDAEGNPIEA